MDREKFDKFRDKMSLLFKDIKQENLIQKSVDMMNEIHFCFNVFMKEYKVYKDMLVDKEKMYGELYLKFRYDNNQGARTKVEIESFIHCNEAYCDLCYRINEQEMIVKYAEEMTDRIQKVSYSIKNIVDLKQLGMGS